MVLTLKAAEGAEALLAGAYPDLPWLALIEEHYKQANEDDWGIGQVYADNHNR